jgi:predicted metal-dependent phosphoesterase TrpH
VKANQLVDFHVHSNHSFDAVMSPAMLIKRAKEKGVAWMSITDHNNLDGVRELYQKYNGDLTSPAIYCDGVNLISGVEVTCRVGSVMNYKGRTSKVHLLVYGADISPDSPLSRLIEIKKQNDRDVDLGVLEYMLSLKQGHNITERHIRQYIQDKRKQEPHYSTIKESDIYEFLTLYGGPITFARSYKHFCEIMENAPKINRVNIDAGDLIKIAHASGGFVVLAHPEQNLRRTPHPRELVEALVDAGLDGFETMYNGNKASSNELITSVIRRKRPNNFIAYTGGSDTHSFVNGNTLGNFNNREILDSLTHKRFIGEIYDLMHARLDGKLTHRKYPNMQSQDIEKMILTYTHYALESRKDVPTLAESSVPKYTYSPPKKKGGKPKKKKDGYKSEKQRNREKRKRDNYVRTIEEKEIYTDYIKHMEDYYSVNSDSMLDEDDYTNE